MPSASSQGRARSSASRRPTPRNRSPLAALAATVPRRRIGRCRTAATAPRICDRVTGRPSSRTSPVTRWRPSRPRARSSVDLPAPLGPSTASVRPGGHVQGRGVHEFVPAGVHAQVAAAEPGGHRSAVRRCWTRVSARFTANAITSRTRPNAMARANWPRLVASTAAVVRTRVWPAMLPPDHLRGPDLADHRAERGHGRGQQRQPRFAEQRDAASAAGPAPRPCIWIRNSGSTCWTATAVSATTIGVAMSGLRDDHRGRACRAGPARRAGRCARAGR